MTKGKITLTVNEDLLEVHPAEEESTQLDRLQRIARQGYLLRQADMALTPDEDRVAMLLNGLYFLVEELPEEDFGWAPEEES